MNPETSSRPCIETAANWSPVIQPSVLVSRAATLAAERSSPIISLRKAAASSGVKRKSEARSSVNSPRPRRRASGKGGSERLTMTRCI